jgi:hypothetical protein
MGCKQLRDCSGATKAEKINGLIHQKLKLEFEKNELPSLAKDKKLKALDDAKKLAETKHTTATKEYEAYAKKLGLSPGTNYSGNVPKRMYSADYNKCFTPTKTHNALEKAKTLAALGKHSEANKLFEEIIFEYKLLE